MFSYFPTLNGGWEIFRKRENSLFGVLKLTTGKLYNLPHYFCLGLWFTNEMLYFVGNVIAIISSKQESCNSFLQISELKKKLFGYETVPPTPKKSGDSNTQSQEEINRYESLSLLLLKQLGP